VPRAKVSGNTLAGRLGSSKSVGSQRNNEICVNHDLERGGVDTGSPARYRTRSRTINARAFSTFEYDDRC